MHFLLRSCKTEYPQHIPLRIIHYHLYHIYYMSEYYYSIFISYMEPYSPSLNRNSKSLEVSPNIASYIFSNLYYYKSIIISHSYRDSILPNNKLQTVKFHLQVYILFQQIISYPYITMVIECILSLPHRTQLAQQQNNNV